MQLTGVSAEKLQNGYLRLRFQNGESCQLEPYRVKRLLRLTANEDFIWVNEPGCALLASKSGVTITLCFAQEVRHDVWNTRAEAVLVQLDEVKFTDFLTENWSL